MRKEAQNHSLILLFTLLWIASTAIPTYAQSTAATVGSSAGSMAASSTPQLQIRTESDGVSLTWSLSNLSTQSVSAAMLDTTLQSMSTVRHGDYEVPARLETFLLVDPDAANDIRVANVSSRPYSGQLRPAKPLEPTAIGWQEEYEPAPSNGLALPNAPITILRKGIVRGHTVIVAEIAAIFETNGALRVADGFEAYIPGAVPLRNGISELLNPATVKAASLEQPLSAVVTGPTNPPALKAAVRIRVRQAGIQLMSGAELIAAGMAEGTDLTKVQVWYQGTPIAIDVRDTNNKLDNNSQIRFYARAPEQSMKVGDYWNDTETYWATVEATNGKRMATRSAAPGSASLRATAIERGIWQDYVEHEEDDNNYESTMAGVDGDHWFSEEMDVAPGETTLLPELTVELGNKLPLAANGVEFSKFRFTGSARTIATHNLKVEYPGLNETLTWSSQHFYQNWQETVESSAHASQMKLTLLSGTEPSGIRFDKIYWEQPVTLDFADKGAAFSGVEGVWRYQMTDVPTGSTLYDVTDPAAPEILKIAATATVQFEDGPEAHDYILAASGTLHTPELSKHTPVSFPKATGALAIYISPSNFIDELAPLVAHRNAQGYSVQTIDVQHIYDAWSYGQISPDAIRNFLRFAMANWSPKPIAFTLVGDSTTDPHNYTGMRDGVANKLIIPDYAANIDPWIGRTACQPCMAQLDGDDPLDDTDKGFLIDIWPGRFSVQDESQLRTVVEKILRYETATDLGLEATWRQSSVYVADDYVRANGSIDPAGDFAAFTDEAIAKYQSPNMSVERIYYDPRPEKAGILGRYQNPVVAHSAVIDAFNRGSGIVSYNGHSHHFQWAVTDINANPSYLFGTNDILGLTNRDRLSILLEMTCYTAQFTRVSRSGTTMDERFQRHNNGGAVAIYGPAGLTVVHGHDQLLAGFQERLWSRPRYQAKMGELTEAGYFRLFEKGGCCQDARQSFLLLGDPLTPALVQAPDKIYMPFAARE